MIKFTKILENTKNENYYKVSARLELIVKAENEGEAGYLSDSIIASLEDLDSHTIENIEQTQEPVYEGKSLIKKQLTNDEYQMVSGIIDILKKVKDKENRMEIADSMIYQFKREKIKFDYDDFLSLVNNI